MLNYEEQTAGPVAEVRVTAQELARAVAAVEGRREAFSQQEAETIPLGEAVRQLGLSVTPEELLAEIRAQRTNTTAVTPRRTVLKPLALLKFLFAASLLACLALGLRLLYVMNESPFAPPLSVITEPSSGESAVRLSDVPDNQPVYSDLGTIYELNHGKASDQIRVGREQSDIENDPARHWWELVKLNGELYVRGWVSSDGIGMPSGSQANFFNRRYSGLPSMTVRTVPIEKFKDILDPALVTTQGMNEHVEGVPLPDETMN
jgi:hypothetical protein